MTAIEVANSRAAVITRRKDEWNLMGVVIRVAQLVLVGAGTAAFSLICQWPLAGKHNDLVALNVVTSLALTISGFALSWLRRLGSWHLALIGVGVLWSLRWTGSWEVGPLPMLSGYFNILIYAVGGQLMLLNPNRHASTRLDRAVVLWFWIGAPLTQIALIMTSSPEWAGFPRDVWWWNPFVNRDAFEAVALMTTVLDVAAAVAFVVALVRRVKWMVGLDRMISAPIYMATALCGALSAAATGEELLSLPSASAGYAVLCATFIAVPIGFVVASMLRELEHAAISRVLHQAFSDAPTDVHAAEAALRTSLRDPSLSLYIWDEASEGFIGQAGRRVELSGNVSKARMTRRLVAPNGNVVGFIDSDIALEHHPSLVETATSACAVALQNLQLHGDLEARLEQLQESRARIAQAALDERRRIERDLHDGVQQRLLAAVARLGVLQRRIDPSEAEIVDDVSVELRKTLEDLRNLANGIHPLELRQFGLKPALELVAERLPLLVESDIDDFRTETQIEATLYFVACEALANTVKHAQASRAAVLVMSTRDKFVLEVHDDGCGGASVANGSGLVGCDDRVRSIGGDFEVMRSSRLGGTLVKARIPL